MTIFEKISNTYQRIEEVKEKIFVLEMQACTPKSCEITGMPRGGGDATNPIELYLERKEKLEKQLKALNVRLKHQWIVANRLMEKGRIDEQTKRMMYFRFHEGLQWKECAAKLDKEYPNCKWNENKCFRKYREVLFKIS